jgi:hypothetical protein
VSIAIGFLVADSVHCPDIWTEWFDGRGTAIFHQHKKGAGQPAQLTNDVRVVRTVPTRWESTINAHFALYEEFLKTSASHLILASESCVPRRSYEALLDTLSTRAANCSYFASLHESTFNHARGGRKVHPDIRDSIYWHEQWYWISREHVEVLRQNNREVRRLFCCPPDMRAPSKVFADNEHFAASCLRRFGRDDEIVSFPTTYTSWPSRSRHPRKFAGLGAQQLKDSRDYYFFRKVVPGAKLELLREELKNDTLVADTASELTKHVPAMYKTAAIYVHMYYYDLWAELANAIRNVQHAGLRVKVYVNQVQRGTETEAMRRQIKVEFPTATVLVSENRGRDIGGLVNLLNSSNPASYDYCAFIHSKHTKQEPGKGKRWRKELLGAIMSSPAKVRECIQHLDKKGGIVGTRRWYIRNGATHEHCKHFAKRINVTYRHKKYIAGTMWWCAPQLLQHIKNQGLTQDYFEPEAGQLDNTQAHAFERVITNLCEHYKKRTIPVQSKPMQIAKHTTVKEYRQKEPYLLEYDTEKYKWREYMRLILQLSNLKEAVQLDKVLTREEDTNTLYHKRFYKAWQEKPLLRELYKAFIVDICKLLGHTHLYYQSVPSFRAHLVNNVSVGEWHVDSDYGHQPEEVNLWLPFVDTTHTNTIHIEAPAGKIAPEVSYGQILAFKGAELRHGNIINKDYSRFSIDFRIIHPDDFKPTGKESINGVTTFELGGYWSECRV